MDISFFLGVANALSTAALAVYVLTRPTPAEDTEMRSKVRQLDADLDDLFDRMKRLTSRKGMQAKRDERAANPYARLPNETETEWKARARKLRQNGIEPQTET